MTDGMTYYTVDTGYAILPDGRIVTSDGKPRAVDDHQLRVVAEKAAKEGREIEFRYVSRAEIKDGCPHAK